MRLKHTLWTALVLLLTGACAPLPTLTPERTAPPPTEAASALAETSGCQVKAVDLIGAWVDAGASDSTPFEFTDLDGNTCEGTFTDDILPLFTQANAWFDGSPACASCHNGNTETSLHEMDLTSYEGIMKGGDVLSAPPGSPIIVPGDWKASKLRGRLRNNRMPPGWTFDITETNRNGPCVEVSNEGVSLVKEDNGKLAYGCELNAVGLLGAWVDAGAPNGEFEFGGATLTFERDVLPFFTQSGMWFEGSPACASCHNGNTETSLHEMDLTNYEGILKGADVVSNPPGAPIIVPGDWHASKLRDRLRNNRMPPGWTFDITEANRDGPVVTAGHKK